jgi:hypothetical protein
MSTMLKAALHKRPLIVGIARVRTLREMLPSVSGVGGEVALSLVGKESRIGEILSITG